jgi:LuxR family maltose regulon positive regulatory protein
LPELGRDFGLLRAVQRGIGQHGGKRSVRSSGSCRDQAGRHGNTLDVHRGLPTNPSRPEIGSELSVSVNTVNTHVRNVYAKLGAQDRSSAVQRAREQRLLSAGLPR